MNSRDKGARGEREWAHFLTDNGFPAERGQQHSGHPDSPDVKCELLNVFHFEVKRVQALNLQLAIEQAIKDSSSEQIPIVAHRKNGKDWMITIKATDWVSMVKSATTVDGHIVFSSDEAK